MTNKPKKKGIETLLTGRIPIPQTPLNHSTTRIKYYHHFNISVEKYSQKGKRNDFPKPEICPICKEISTCLVGWGYYFRWACTAFKGYQIVIKVWKCKRQKTGGYISIQPSFMIPYKQYTFTVIYKVLRQYLIFGLTINKSLRKVFCKSVMPPYQTVQHWIKGANVSCSRWIGIMQEAGKFNIACPKKWGHLRPIELVHFMIVLERYLRPAQVDIEIDSLHYQLVKRYHSSPLSQYQFR